MVKLNPEKVPPQLYPAIPEEGAVIELTEQTSTEELEEFLALFDTLAEQVINTWLRWNLTSGNQETDRSKSNMAILAER